MSTAHLSNPSPAAREAATGQEAVVRIRAMQREVDELRLRLEEELGRVGVVREGVGPGTPVVAEMRRLLLDSRAQKERLVEDAAKVRDGVRKTFESARGLLEEVDAILHAARGELAQVEALERYLGGGAQTAPARQPVQQPATRAEPRIAATDGDQASMAGRREPTADAATAAASGSAASARRESDGRSDQTPARPAAAQTVEPAGTRRQREASPAEPPARPPVQRPAPPSRPEQQETEQSLESALEKALGGAFRDKTPEAPSSTAARRGEPSPRRELPPREPSAAANGLEQELSAALGNWADWDKGATAAEADARQGGDGASQAPRLSARELGSPYTGTFYITVRPLLGGTAFGRFWTSLEKVLGVGKVIDSSPLRDRSALRLTVEMGKDQVTVSQLVSGIPDAEFHRVDDKNLEVNLSESG